MAERHAALDVMTGSANLRFGNRQLKRVIKPDLEFSA
jgi:hypothetical protein